MACLKRVALQCDPTGWLLIFREGVLAAVSKIDASVTPEFAAIGPQWNLSASAPSSRELERLLLVISEAQKSSALTLELLNFPPILVTDQQGRQTVVIDS